MIIAETSPDDGVPVVASLRGWLIWFTAALFYFYEFFVRVAPSTMEPELQDAFRLTAAGLGAAMGVYYVVYSPMQLLAGSLFDRFGAKRVLVPAVAIVGAGCLLEVLGHSDFLLTAARFMQGFGSAFAFVGTMFLAAEWFPRSMLALLSGLTTSLGMAGAILGNAGIATVVETFGWHPAMICAAGVGLIVAVAILFVVPHESPARRARGEAAELPQRPNVFRALLTVYANPQSWYAGLVGTALYMPLSVLGALWGQEYIMTVGAMDHEPAANAISMLYVGWLIGGPLAGLYSDRTGVRRNLLLTASVATLLTTLAFVFVPSLSVPGAYALMLLLGLVSCSQVVCFVAAVEHNPARVAGTAIAATNMMIMLFGGIGEWAFGLILDWVGGGASPATETAYRRAFLLLPAISAVGVVAVLLLKESSHPAEAPVDPQPTV